MKTQPAGKKMGQWMTIGMWILFLAMLSYFFNGVLEQQHNPNTSVASRVTHEGVREITQQRNRFGHYVASGNINGMEVTFLLDTGATDVAVPASIANKLGLKKGAPITFQTANEESDHRGDWGTDRGHGMGLSCRVFGLDVYVSLAFTLWDPADGDFFSTRPF